MRHTIFVLALMAVGTIEAFAEASAPEIFSLRKQCQVMAETMAESHVNGPYWFQTATSNYSIRSQHCYVLLELATADTTVALSAYKHRAYLYDGHTNELLAWTKVEGGDKSGSVSDQYFDGPNSGFEAASAYVKTRMNPER